MGPRAGENDRFAVRRPARRHEQDAEVRQPAAVASVQIHHEDFAVRDGADGVGDSGTEETFFAEEGEENLVAEEMDHLEAVGVGALIFLADDQHARSDVEQAHRDFNAVAGFGVGAFDKVFGADDFPVFHREGAELHARDAGVFQIPRAVDDVKFAGHFHIGGDRLGQLARQVAGFRAALVVKRGIAMAIF
ncbi:MAG: hypothetical protein M5R36_00755 [Deltaproteobacteria bacterium]|nr:hypothetical protein [Deltaproteobacteria bacterium]